MRIAWLTLVLAITACESTPTRTSASIGPAGGTVKLGQSSVTVPAGALASTVEIVVRDADTAAPPSGTDPVGPMLQMLPEGQQFAQPVTVRLAVDLDAIPVGKSVADVIAFTAPAGATSWEPLATTPDGTRVVRAEVSHFSLFVPSVLKPGVDLSGPIDFAVAVGDMSVAPQDLGPADLADRDAACVRSYMMNTTSCSLSQAASCSGNSYQISCSTGDMAIWDCICSKNGSNTKTYYKAITSACQQSSLEADWISQCAFGPQP